MATGQKKLRDPSERVARRLLAEGRIPRDLYDQAMRQRSVKGIRFEEALIEAGLSEEQLLRLLAEMYRVQYISTAKLAAATIDKRTLALVPGQVAEQRQVVPVLLDRQRSVLSVVTADPEDAETLKELELATQVRTIRALVARPSAVEAAVKKFYLGDDFSFSVLRNENYDMARALQRDPLASLHSPAGEQMLTEQGGLSNAEPDPLDSVFPGPPLSVPNSAHSSGQHALNRMAAQASPPIDIVISPDETLDMDAPRLPSVPPSSLRRSSMTAPAKAASVPPGGRLSGAPARPSRSMPAVNVPRVALTPPPPPPSAPVRRRPEEEPMPVSARTAVLQADPPLELAAPFEPKKIPRVREDKPTPAPKEVTAKETTSKEPDPTSSEIIGEPLQLAVVMVSLFEGNRKDLRGHSVQTARLVRTVCERFNVSPARTSAAEVAALIHDLGKASSYHLTPYNVASFDGHRAAAQKLHATPARVVESARLAKVAVNAVLHMYERYDGQGFPGGQRASEIPLESRILAICDSYTDLTNNPRNSFRKVLSAQEACEALRALQGAVFDPTVVDRFSHVVLGDEIAQRLRGDRGTVLLVDPDVEETTVLELALLEKRYDVYVARSFEEALHFVENATVDVVVSETVLEPGSGFELLQKLRARAGGETLPFVFLSHETDSARVAAALEAGAADYLFKPLATQVVLAKLRRTMEQNQGARRVRGVSGSLEEMGIADLVQILHQGRKTGALQLSSEGDEGAVYFKDGAVEDAVFRDLKGEDAFYAIVSVTSGSFTIDPTVSPPEKSISASPEMLLLEGMRRLDEASRGEA